SGSSRSTTLRSRGDGAMRIGMRIGFGIALALLVAGAVYGVTAHEREGAVLLLLCAVAFAYVGLVLRRAVRGPSSPEDAGGPAQHLAVRLLDRRPGARRRDRGRPLGPDPRGHRVRGGGGRLVQGRRPSASGRRRRRGLRVRS